MAAASSSSSHQAAAALPASSARSSRPQGSSFSPYRAPAASSASAHPPAAAASSSSSSLPAQPSASSFVPVAIAEAELVMAYRLDLMNPQEALGLGLEMAEDLARLMKIGAEVYTLKGGDFSGADPVEIEPLTEFNTRLLRNNSTHRLLMNNQTFTVVTGCAEEEAEYLERHRHGQSSPYRDCQEPGDPIITEGDSLIASLFFMKRDRFPRETELAGLRCMAVCRLTTREVEQRLAALQLDLIRNAPDRPMTDGRFPGCGPRVNIILQNDPRFMLAWAQALAKPAQPGMATFNAIGVDMEDPDLQAAIERSMADQG